MDRKKLLGREGEAARYLERKGYEILGLNYSCRYGEIDVIAEKGGYAAIVEVKLRESAEFAEARVCHQGQAGEAPPRGSALDDDERYLSPAAL